MAEFNGIGDDTIRSVQLQLEDEVPKSVPTVLIVEDDATARLALAAMIRPDRLRIVFASSASEVMGRLARIDPDVIVCDVVMDGMCGDEFFRWLKAHPQWHLVPVVAVTQLDSPVVRAHLLEAGADSVLCKPCDARELRAHVHAALRTANKYAQIALQGQGTG